MSDTMPNLLAAAGFFTSVRHAINWVTQPALFISLSIGVFILMFVFYKWWTKPAVFAVIFIGFLAAYFGSMGDPNYKSIVAKPDNVPITIMVMTVLFCFWLGFRSAAVNHSRVAAVLALLEEDRDDTV